MRSTLAGLAAALAIGLTSGCTPTTAPTSTTPTAAPTTATPTPTPSRTYGPNQTAAMASVTAYYNWINTSYKAPLDRNMIALGKLAQGEAFDAAVAGTSALLQRQHHQVGDLVIAEMIPDAEQASQIGVAVCLDASNAVRVDASGNVVQPTDGLTRRAYQLKVKLVDGHWLVIEDRGGSNSC